MWEHMCIVLLIGGEEGCVRITRCTLSTCPAGGLFLLATEQVFPPKSQSWIKKICKCFLPVSGVGINDYDLFWASKYDIASAFFK